MPLYTELINPDGNCLFGAISDQLYNDSGARANEVRAEICEYARTNRGVLEALYREGGDPFPIGDHETEVNESLDDRVERMTTPGQWGGYFELLVAARLYEYVLPRRHACIFYWKTLSSTTTNVG
jgi:OTU-like cysteine protease